MFERYGCQPSCERLKYKLEAGDVNLTPVRHDSDNSTYTLHMYFAEPSFTVREEFEVYGWMSFLADCGGMGGILLGFSLLGAFNWVEEMPILSEMWEKMMRKKKYVRTDVE